ncbi:DUF732 domain-containing protein [Mycolicibacterium phocaicum]|uniref:DUF732 domain-containing protein n=1 Tax=Mycolicibacterium phocaicum TaxID=319706 RepID=A0A7I7ZNA1_9MYCO|nr:DUF732 domain-containing protein [Mycolicibacterium phocaicum]TLH72359.1 DUF732 domain-containing protein [Mycolicibacterium phocaicum]BBZ55229.1 hypothetical protein MPHO_22210 [Mycolicibacterium phocaicum]
MTTNLSRVRVLLAATATALVGLFVAGPAEADQYDFVSNLDNNGVYYSSISGVIDAGKMTCRLLRSGAGVPGALGFLSRVGYARYESATIVVAAADNMCPDVEPVIDAFLNQPTGEGVRA